jgi:hypothetical protein
VKQAAFDARILELWTKTRLPLTRANVVAVTGVPVKKAEAWLDVMVRDELLEVDSNDDGDLLWTVRGSERPARGLQTVAEVMKMQSLTKELERPADADKKRGSAPVILASAADKKSVVLSGALSFFLGPIGLIYAAPMSVALPAALAWLIAGAIIPSFLLVYIAGVVCPVSSIAGVLYAWGYNRAGKRVRLLSSDRPAARNLLRR